MSDRLLLAAIAALSWRTRRNYLALPLLPTDFHIDAAPRVSVIVPARNEASKLPGLLQSLRDSRYPDLEIIVVDDESSDRTATVAREQGVRVLDGRPLPQGWSGKCWACHQGALEATGEWLLFTDADTTHSPDSLSRAVSAAHSSAIDLLSLMPAQICITFWEKLLVPYAHAMYFAGARRVNEPGGATVANGQYMLFRKDAYGRAGGHAAVRQSIIEDIDMARLMVRVGSNVTLLRAGESVHVRMYDGLAGIWEGFAKNAFRFVVANPRGGFWTVMSTLVYSLAFPQFLRARNPLRSAALYSLPALSLAPWLREARVPLIFAMLYPAAVAVFQCIALDAIRRTLMPGMTVWKGRRY